jgi:hypothetical protein
MKPISKQNAGLKVRAVLSAAFALGAAAPSASTPQSPAPSVIRGADLPNDPSNPPSAGEWASAQPVRINRGDPGPCVASRVREWLRLRCPGWIGGGLVAGDPKGVSLTAFGQVGESDNHALTTLVLPLSRGQARIVSFMQLGEEYNSDSYAEGGMLSVVWRRDQADPILVMSVRAAPRMQ